MFFPQSHADGKILFPSYTENIPNNSAVFFTFLNWRIRIVLDNTDWTILQATRWNARHVYKYIYSHGPPDLSSRVKIPTGYHTDCLCNSGCLLLSLPATATRIAVLREWRPPVKMALIKVYKQKLERMWRKGNPPTLLVGMQTSTATFKKSVEIP